MHFPRMLLILFAAVMETKGIYKRSSRVQGEIKCQSNEDCELLGTCSSNGVCKCAPGFTGPTCGRLNLVPLQKKKISNTIDYFPGRVWPMTNCTIDDIPWNTTMSWSFSPVYDPQTKTWNAVVESGCGPTWVDEKRASDPTMIAAPMWLAAISSDKPDRGFTFKKRLSPDWANSPHLLRTKNGTWVLYFQASHVADNATLGSTCTGNATKNYSPSQAINAAFPTCNKDQTPLRDHCLCSHVRMDDTVLSCERWKSFVFVSNCSDARAGVYVATTTKWPDGPWEVSFVSVTGRGWAPYNDSISSIGFSNPAAALLEDGSVLLGFRSHAGYWPGVDGEHIGFAMSRSFNGPFSVVGNLSWEYNNDEDPFVWQQPDGSLHCLYHNGRGSKHVNHGLHAFSHDGSHWHKPKDALTAKCIDNPHDCTFLYNNSLVFADGSSTDLSGRERPSLVFDPLTKAPLYLYNGAIPGSYAPADAPWYAIAQEIQH